MTEPQHTVWKPKPERHFWIGVLLIVGLLVLYQVYFRLRWGMVARRSEPLIAAIEKYGVDHGEPPPSLEALIPIYLETITSATSIPPRDYWYFRHYPSTDDYGNSYTLEVGTAGFLSFDQFLFHPSGRYPPDSHGNTYQRIGRWSYFHE